MRSDSFKVLVGLAKHRAQKIVEVTHRLRRVAAELLDVDALPPVECLGPSLLKGQQLERMGRNEEPAGTALLVVSGMLNLRPGEHTVSNRERIEMKRQGDYLLRASQPTSPGNASPRRILLCV